MYLRGNCRWVPLTPIPYIFVVLVNFQLKFPLFLMEFDALILCVATAKVRLNGMEWTTWSLKSKYYKRKLTYIRLTQYHLAVPGRFKWHLVKFCTFNKSSWKMQFSNRLKSLKHVWNCVHRKSLELQGSCKLTFYILCLSRAQRKKLIFRPIV